MPAGTYDSVHSQSQKFRYGPWQKVTAEKEFGIYVGVWLISRESDGLWLPRLGHRKNQNVVLFSLLGHLFCRKPAALGVTTSSPLERPMW